MGANVGQSAIKLARYFPQAKIHSFEPVEVSYQAGQAATAHLDNVLCHGVVVGDANKTVDLYSSGTSQLASLGSSALCTMEKHTTPMITLDGFCAEHNISRIDVLKTDTEGFDVQALRGAERLLSAQAVGCVLCETGFNNTDKSHSFFRRSTPI